MPDRTTRKTMKRHVIFAALLALCASAFAGCDYDYGSDPVNPEDLPRVALERIRVGTDDMTFTIEVRNSTKAAYICLTPDIEPPDVAGILNYGIQAQTEGKKTRTLTGLESGADYILYAGSTDGETYSKVVSLKFSTSMEAGPFVSLYAGEASATSLGFKAAVNAADRAAYLCRPSGDTAPGAELILAEGAPLSVNGEQAPYTVTGLQPSTDYTIYAVASRAGSNGSVRRLEMTTSAD